MIDIIRSRTLQEMKIGALDIFQDLDFLLGQAVVSRSHPQRIHTLLIRNVLVCVEVP